MEFSLTREQKELLEKAEWLARERLEPRAERYDAEASHTWESWNDVWENGLLTLTVPQEYGGNKVDMPTYVMAIERLAGGCTSTAMTVHMHSVVQRYVEALGTHKQKERLWADVVERGKLSGSWGSEPERHGGTGVGDTVLSPKSDGYVLNGRKHFCTMAGAAFRGLVHSTVEGYERAQGYILPLVPWDTPGITVVGGWDTLGMRGTVSPAVNFEQVQVSAEDVLGEPGQAYKLGIGQSFGLGYAAVYIGAGQRAVDFTVEYVQTHQIAPDPATLSHSRMVQDHVAEMTMALDGARLVLLQSAYAWPDKTPAEKAVLGARAKYVATEASLLATSRALQTVGGRSAYKSVPLERLFRDVRTCTLMPPNPDRAKEIIGKDLLDVPDEILSRFTPVS